MQLLWTIRTINCMKTIAYIGLGILLASCSVTKQKPSLKSILIEQLKNTHTNEDWFTPLNKAISGLTAEQANWADSSENHSIGQLVTHLTFWNERVLMAFHNNTVPDFTGNNQETFTKFDKTHWEQSVHRLDSIQRQWEYAVEHATDEQLAKWSSSIANLCSHNAYHTGQIIYIRKRNGWWKLPK